MRLTTLILNQWVSKQLCNKYCAIVTSLKPFIFFNKEDSTNQTIVHVHNEKNVDTQSVSDSQDLKIEKYLLGCR